MKDKETFFEVDPSKPKSKGCNELSEEDRLSLECTICEHKRDLVRDHNHNTGFIRGILCDKCNSWLGVYCKNKYGGKNLGRGSYKKWVDKYEDKIKVFLSDDVGIQYSGFRSKVLLEKMRRRGVQLNGTKYKETNIDTSPEIEVSDNFVKIVL